ncbi:hypothetical protein FKW77_000515 [Venturia effusa]|uniref:Aminoglycoside phosphotransferase domain-containing protein n=1 Tax=Venturia effusa TaxID=50376 RepID=A0A517LJJ5_9PEZI|nr:hypothetical protein FKW77_000515 [Venturia effusa]
MASTTDHEDCPLNDGQARKEDERDTGSGTNSSNHHQPTHRADHNSNMETSGHSTHAERDDSEDTDLEDTLPESRLPTDAVEPENENDNTSVVSATSTFMFGHEKLNDLHSKIMELCEQLWPAKIGRFKVKKLANGGNNRVISITIRSPKLKASDVLRQTTNRRETPAVFKSLLKRSKNSERYVLRMPWDEYGRDLGQEEGHLRLVTGLTSVSVPTILFSDLTENNVLGRPYAIHDRIPGVCLTDVLAKLSHGQRLSLAKQIGAFYRALSRHTFPCAGVVDPNSIPTISTPASELVIVRPVQVSRGPRFVPTLKDQPAERETPVAVVRRLLRAWKVLDHGYKPDVRWDPEFDWPPYDKLAIIATQMNWGPEDRFFISHGSFSPRNIMVLPSGDSCKLTGIIDWDRTNLAPAAVAFQKPCWLWCGETCVDMCEPTDQKSMDVKAAFEKKAGAFVTTYCNSPDNDLAWLIWWWSDKDLNDMEDIQQAVEEVKKWEARTRKGDDSEAFWNELGMGNGVVPPYEGSSDDESDS